MLVVVRFTRQSRARDRLAFAGARSDASRLCVARALGLIWLTFARKAVVTPLLLLLLLLLVLQLHLPFEKCVFFSFLHVVVVMALAFF